MWKIIKNSDHLFDSKEYGETIYRLSKINKKESSIIPCDTIVLSSAHFQTYIDNRYVDESIISDCICQLRQIGLSDNNRIDIAYSFLKECNVDSNPIVTNANSACIRNAITELYERWFDGKPYSFRIAHKMKKEDTFPSIYIQPHQEQIYSLITRHPSSGKLIFFDDWLHLVHCSIPSMQSIEKKLVSLVDIVFLCPQKIYFFYDNNRYDGGINRLVIKKMEDYHMTRNAYLSTLIEKHRQKWITDEELINNIRPEDIVSFQGYRLFAQYLYKSFGLSYGKAQGKAIFLNSDWERINLSSNNQYILFAEFFRPEDFEKVKKCAGIILVRPGITSHEGVFCRGQGLPAITCNMISINNKTNTVTTGQETIREGDDIYLSCSCEKAVWGKNGMFEPIYSLSVEDNPIQYLIVVCKQLSNASSLLSQSMDFQIHLASLLHALKLAGYTI